jgi:hypothetical protein
MGQSNERNRMNSPKIDLTPFCATRDDPRTYLRQPFSFDKFTAASNGHIMIVTERQPNTQEHCEKPNLPNLAKYIKNLYARLGQESAVFALDGFLPELRPCCECDGHGSVFQCPECDGAGEIACWEDCKKCDGSGTVSLPVFAEMLSKNILLSGKLPFLCQTCRGLGQQSFDKSATIGDANFQSRYLLLAKTLPGATLHTWQKHDAGLLIFESGFGLIMPLRDKYYIGV